jgi:hypothetical protein
VAGQYAFGAQMPWRSSIVAGSKRCPILEATMREVEDVLAELAKSRFYGTVEVKFEAGLPVLLRKTETIKPTNERDRNNRGPNERNHD